MVYIYPTPTDADFIRMAVSGGVCLVISWLVWYGVENGDM